jgi:hypothetical protein
MFSPVNSRATFMPMLFLLGIVLTGCEESKRYEISSNDNIPPDVPIFIDSKPLPGGARIFYRIPTDEDVLSIEASYQNVEGKTVRFIASYFTDSLEVWGFNNEGEHKINLCAIDRAGNRSGMIEETVVALEPPVVAVAKSIAVLPSFSSIMLKWNNSLMEPVYVSVDFSYTEKGRVRNHSSVFSSYQLNEKQHIDNLIPDENSEVEVSVSVKDKFGNSVSAETTSIVLLTDNELDKTEWTLPLPGFSLGGVIQANGNEGDGDMDELIDGITEASVFQNYYLTNQSNPWNIIIDLGSQKELSRIVTHQRYTGEQSDSPQGNYYKGDNVLSYNMYIWDENTQSWEFVSRNDILTPVVKQTSDYKLLGDAGDEAFFYPEEPKFSKPTRYFRLEAIKGKYISEITLYGKSI